MASNTPFVISPASLSKLSLADSTRLCTYIEALERQNKTKNQEQVIMDRYIENLRAEVDEMMAADIERKNRENYLNNQIKYLTNDNQILLSELKSRNEKIVFLSQQLENLKRINLQGHEFRAKIQNQYQEHLNKIIQQNNEVIKGVEANRTEQLNKILALNYELNEKCRKFELNYAEAVQKSSRLQQKNDSLYKENMVFREQLSEANRKVEQKTYGQKMKSIEIANMNEYLKQIENTNKQLMQENSRIHECMQKDQKSKELFQRETINKLKRYEAEIQDWKSRHTELEQFLDFVKQNIKEMQSTICEQNKNIQALSKSNTNLRNEILLNIINLADQTQKQRQLNETKLELASCKGKLAEKQRILSTCSSKVLTPFDQYSLKIKLKHDDTDEDTRSKGTYSERNRNINRKGVARRTNFHGSQNFIING